MSFDFPFQDGDAHDACMISLKKQIFVSIPLCIVNLTAETKLLFWEGKLYRDKYFAMKG